MSAFGSDPKYGQVKGYRDVCTTAGTREQLSDVKGQCFIFQACRSNTGNVMLGDVTVDITDDSENGIELEAGQTVTLYITNANLLYIDADNSGDAVAYTVLA